MAFLGAFCGAPPPGPAAPGPPAPAAAPAPCDAAPGGAPPGGTRGVFCAVGLLTTATCTSASESSESESGRSDMSIMLDGCVDVLVVEPDAVEVEAEVDVCASGCCGRLAAGVLAGCGG